MQRESTIELFKENMKFSAAHFTVFSSSVRENLHGHNYQVYAAFTTVIADEGLSFDYGHYKDKLLDICRSLDETTIIPAHCKYLKVDETEKHVTVTFDGESFQLLKRDAKVLPITNVTVEELSNWILQQLLLDKKEIEQNKIHKIKVKVFSGPGRSGSAKWRYVE